MAFGKLNFFGYLVVSSVLLTVGAILFGKLMYEAAFFEIAVVTQWVALRKTEPDSATNSDGAGPDDGESDDRRRRRERKLEGKKAEASGGGGSG